MVPQRVYPLLWGVFKQCMDYIIGPTSSCSFIFCCKTWGCQWNVRFFGEEQRSYLSHFSRNSPLQRYRNLSGNNCYFLKICFIILLLDNKPHDFVKGLKSLMSYSYSTLKKIKNKKKKKESKLTALNWALKINKNTFKTFTN